MAATAHPSIDHLIRALQHRWWDREADRLGRPTVDHELELRRLLYGKVRRLREFWEPSAAALDPSVLDQHVHALVPAALLQTLPESLPQPSLGGVQGFVPQDADAVHLPRRLRACGERHGEDQEGEDGAEPSDSWFQLKKSGSRTARPGRPSHSMI